jgi:hypothetical protein
MSGNNVRISIFTQEENVEQHAPNVQQRIGYENLLNNLEDRALAVSGGGTGE